MKATFALSVSALAASALAAPRNFSTIQPSGTFNPAAATAVQTHYPKYHHTVKGKFVDHIWHIVLGSADYDDVASNSDFQELAKKGVTLTNYYGLAQPAQANYLGMVAGDTFGLTDERFVALPENISTVVESLERQRVLWAQYVEGQPFTAYTGWEYEPNNYTRAGNPLIAFDSVTSDTKRMINLHSLDTFYGQQNEETLPQWLIIRPSPQHDGSGSDLSTAASWVSDFISPLLEEKKDYHRKIFIVTFASSASTDGPNKVFTLILGDVGDKAGTTDDMYYDHYSIIATTQANFGLPTLGRYDCNANVFDIFNHKTHNVNYNKTVTSDYNQAGHAGWLSDDSIPFAIPNLNCEGAGHAGLVSRVKKIWKKASYSYFQWSVNY